MTDLASTYATPPVSPHIESSERRELVSLSVGKRLAFALAGAGLFSLMTCLAFYLFEVDRLTTQQLAALAHYAGQTMQAADADWQRQLALPTDRAEVPVFLSWSFDAQRSRLERVVKRTTGSLRARHFALDDAWLAAKSGPDMRLYVVYGRQVIASSLGDAGAGEASALSPRLVGKVSRYGHLFVQVPQRWDDHPDSPSLVIQQRLQLPFSLGEIAMAGLLLWALLALVIWLSVGLWLNRALRHVHFLAYHDPLTGLINRAALRVGLVHMMAESRRNQTQLALFYLDLDRFKIINDSLGHAAGDHVLREAALRLQNSVRDSDFVARLGGDEFVVVFGEIVDANAAASVARKIIERMQEPVLFHDRRLHIGCSIGVAMYPGTANTPDELTKQADHAMYAAKQHGRGGYRYYDESLGAKASMRLSLETKMRQALLDGDFRVHYQPVIDDASALRISGFEALARWPSAGSEAGDGIPPDEFIPIAEETDIIVPLGEFVLREACSQLQRWQRTAPHGKHWTMSVNVSARQIEQPGFAARVESILRETGLPPTSLILEITESLYVKITDHVLSALEQLRLAGIRLAMDDFGTGFSSLANLTRLPIDRLKIDRAFVTNITQDTGDQMLARTIIAIGEQLSIEVVAEGVETSEQARILSHNGCHIQQGWLFGKAVSPEHIEKSFAMYSDSTQTSSCEISISEATRMVTIQA